MPQIVEHPDLGEIEFPDEMSQADILKAIEAHQNQGFEVPQPGDDDVSTGQFAGGEPPKVNLPVPIPAPGTSGYSPAQNRFFGSPEQQSAIRSIQGNMPTVGPLNVPEFLFDKLRLDPTTMAEGLRELSSASPDLSPEEAEQLRQTPAPPPSPAMQVATGAINAANKATTSLISPEGAAMLATGGAPGFLARGAQLYFGAQMLHGLPETARRAGEVSATGTPEQKAESYGDLALNLLFTKEALKHGATPAPKPPQINPMREVNMINRSLSTGEFRPGQPLDPALRDRMLERRQTLLDKIQGAETELKDLAGSYDMPLKISAVDPTTQEPWEAGTYAKMGPEGEMYVNRIGLHDILKDLNTKQKQRFMKSLVEEEWIHSKVSDDDAFEYWNNLTPTEQEIVARRYAGPDAEHFSDEQLAHEAVRSRLQQLAGVTPTEIAHADGLNIEVRTLIGLENIIGKARRAFGTEASGVQEEIFNKIKSNIEAARKKLSSNAERTAIDAGEEGLPEPTATSENVPFATRRERPLDDYKGEVPPGYVRATVRRADGTEHETFVTSIEDSKLAGKRLTRVANVVAAGEKGTPELSHGLLGPGDKIIKGPTTPEELNASKGTAPAAFRKQAKAVSEMTDMRELMALPGGLTRAAHELGDMAKSPDDVSHLLKLKAEDAAAMRKLVTEAQNATDPYEKEKLIESMQFPAMRSQYFSEAAEWASGHLPKKVEFYRAQKPDYKPPVPMSPEEFAALQKEANASGKPETATVHGDVRALPGEGTGEVPAQESGAGVQPREGTPGAGPEEAKTVLRLEPGKDVAAATRRKKGQEGSEGDELPLAPGSEAAPRNTEELGLPQVERESVTPAKVEDVAAKHLDAPKPSFDRFMDDMKERFGNVQPGQVREAWEDAVWKKLINAPGAELEALVKKLGVIERMGGIGQGVEPGFIPDIREKTQARSSSTEMFQKPPLTVTEHPPRRANAIARLGEKLIGMALRRSADLKRKVVKPEDVGWWRPKVGELPAFREIPAQEANSQAIGKILTEGGSMERGGKKVTSGLKGYSESVTKRLVALQDRATGRMELVSVYRTGRGTFYAVDPQKAGERVHTPLPELLGKKTVGGEQRYVPRFSVLLDEPVQGFKESFKSEAEFQEKFGAEAAEHQRRMDEAEAGAEEIGPSAEGKPPEKGILFRQEKTSPDSFRALHDVLSGGEDITQESLQENLESLFSENRPKDPKTGRPRELTIRELKGVDALLFAQDRMMEMAREKGTPISPEAALSNVLEYLHENKDLSRSEFASKAFAEFGQAEAALPAPAESVSTGTAAEPKTGARELTLPEGARTAKPTGGVVKASGTGPKAYLSGKDSPSAFRRPTRRDVLWGAERAWDSLAAQVKAETMRNPVSRQITAWRDAADNIPGNVARKAERAIGVSLPNDTALQRAAALAYRETHGGDSVMLDNARASVEAGLPNYRAEKNSEAVRIGELMLKAIDYARDHGPELAAANSEAGRLLNEELLFERSKGIEVTQRDTYTPHVYNADDFSDDATLFPSRILGHKFTAAQQFSSYFSAYENGFYAKKYDLGAVVANRMRRGQMQAQKRIWIERVKNTIDPKSGLPVATETEPYDVTLANGETVTKYRPPSPEYDLFAMSPGQRPIAVRKGYKDLMDVLTMQSPFQKSAITRAALNYNSFLKHSVILIYDTFHPSRIGQYALATTGIRPKVWELGSRGASALDYADAQLDQAVAKGLISQESADWARQTVRVRVGGGEVDLSHRRILEEMEKEGLNVGRISDALYREMTDNIPFVGALNRFTFDKLTRGAMAESAVSEFIRLNRKFPDHDARQLMRDVLRDVNFRFGNVGRQGLLRNPAIRDFAQLFFLAPQWIEGMAQSEARFYARIIKAPFKIGSNAPNMGMIGRTMGRGLAFYFGLTQALNLITKGQTTFQNDEGHKLDAWIPDVTGKTPGFYFSPLSVFAEVTHDIVKYVGKSDRVIDGLSRIVGNKLGPMGRVLATFMFRENPQGEKITTTGGVVKQAAKELLPAPISLSKLGQAGGNLIAPKLIPPAKPGDVQRQLTASLGFKIDPADTALQMMRDKAEAFVKKNHLKREDSEFQLTDQAFYTQLRRAVRNDQEGEAMRLIEQLRSEHPDKEIEKAMHRYAKRHLTGSLAHEQAFVKSLNPKEQEVYRQAREEQGKQLQKFGVLWAKRNKEKS